MIRRMPKENDMSENARSLVCELLQKAERSKQYSNIALDHALEGSSLSPNDKKLASILFYGVLERKLTLDGRISELSDRELSSIDPKVLCALRLGLYQLIYLDRIPAHAAINESVALCSRKSAGFVNALLREHTRRPFTPVSVPKDAAELSVKYSVCKPLADKLIGHYGIEDAALMLDAFFVRRETTLRTNTLKIGRDALLEKIDNASATHNSASGIVAKGAIRELFGFDGGLFFVQDEASQICVEVLGAKSGELVLDVCACPGSKSFGAAIDMQNEGRIIAFDLHENKLSLVRDGAKRLGIDIIETRAADGRVCILELCGKADRIICDVPCSGFGVLSKKPELRYKDPAESAALPAIQRAILDNVSGYLKSGGTLVYSTCTTLPEENENNILAFLADHPDFTLSPWKVGDICAERGYITLLPHLHGTDGFFIAKLIRK